MTAVTSAHLGDRTGDEDYYERMTAADWTAIVAAAVGIVSAVIAVFQARSATSQAESAKTQAVAAAEQVAAAERSAQAAESYAAPARESLETAKKQFRLQIDSVLVDYTPVLVAPKSMHDAETSFRILEIHWKGPRVELDRLVAMLSIDIDGKPSLDQFSW